MADIYAPEFTNEAAAVAHLEKSRWAVSGANCPKCGSFAVRKMEGATQAGYWLCNDCRDKFTCRTGTVMERSHIPVHKWLLAIHLMSASKKGISAHQMHRMLGVTYKSAWFLCHRIREAMSETKGPTNPMGGSGKVVEADETYYGQKADKPKVTTSGRPFVKKGKAAHKIAIVSLVERGGNVRSFHVDRADASTVANIMFTNVKRDSTLHTDESRLYTVLGREYASHDTVNHSAKEYVRGDVHTNTIEGYFSIFKRGMKGVYQHCGSFFAFSVPNSTAARIRRARLTRRSSAKFCRNI